MTKNHKSLTIAPTTRKHRLIWKPCSPLKTRHMPVICRASNFTDALQQVACTAMEIQSSEARLCRKNISREDCDTAIVDSTSGLRIAIKPTSPELSVLARAFLASTFAVRIPSAGLASRHCSQCRRMPSLHSKAVSVMMRGDAHDCEDGMDMTDRSCVLPRQSSFEVAKKKKICCR